MCVSELIDGDPFKVHAFVSESDYRAFSMLNSSLDVFWWEYYYFAGIFLVGNNKCPKLLKGHLYSQQHG